MEGQSTLFREGLHRIMHRSTSHGKDLAEGGSEAEQALTLWKVDHYTSLENVYDVLEVTPLELRARTGLCGCSSLSDVVLRFRDV